MWYLQDAKDGALMMEQVWEFMPDQLERAVKEGLTMGTFVSSANDTTINGCWREHATENWRTRKAYEILGFLSPCWEMKYMERIFSAGKTFIDAFSGSLDYVDQLVAGIVSGVLQIPIQNGPSLYV